MAEKVYEVLNRASLFLEKHHREPKVAEILLQHYLDVSRAAFFAMLREPIPEKVVKVFEQDIKVHAETGVPVQHLIGYETFFGRRFSVNKHVLIPRPETEELVLSVLQYIKDKKEPLTIVDVGTGSGIIAITLALELPDKEVFATDISKEALAVANNNAEELQANVTFYEGDFLEPIVTQHRKVDLIVSNPPYISFAEKDELADTVKDFDPSLALFADEDGLAAYRTITNQAKFVLNKNSVLAFEIGHTQGQAVKEIIQSVFPTSKVEIRKDINGKDRIVFAKICG